MWKGNMTSPSSPGVSDISACSIMDLRDFARVSWWWMTGGSEKAVWEYWISIGVVPFRRIGTGRRACCFGRRQNGFPAGLILAVLSSSALTFDRGGIPFREDANDF